MDAKSFLDNLLKSGGDLADQARDKWDGQSTGTKGAVAGGLLGVLMGGSGGLSGVLRVGGSALIGSLAARAYADWKDGKDPLATVTEALRLPGTDANDDTMTDDFATRLLQAVVAAAKADGRVTPEETARITSQMQSLDLDAGARAQIDADLAAPLDLDRVAALARTPQEAAQIYTTTLLLVDRNGDRAYLDGLGRRLGLDRDLIAHLQARADGLTAG